MDPSEYTEERKNHHPNGRRNIFDGRGQALLNSSLLGMKLGVFNGFIVPILSVYRPDPGIRYFQSLRPNHRMSVMLQKVA
jgi:hypothetical protein